MTDPESETTDEPTPDTDGAAADDAAVDDTATDDGRDNTAGGSFLGIPTDLAVVVLLTILMTAAVTLPVLRSTPIRSLLAVPFVLFLPGYAVVAALFPEAAESADEASEEGNESTGASHTGLTYFERAALSFGVSVAVVPLIGLVLNVTPFGIQLGSVLLLVTQVTLVSSIIALYRRLRLPVRDQFAVPFRAWGRSVIGVFTGHESNADRVLTVLTVLALLLAVSSAGYAFAVPKQADAFTELYIVTEGDDGELVADDYPTEFVSGESKPIVVGVGNYEHRTVEYSLVVELQDVTVENNSTRVREREEVARERITLSDEETWENELNVTPGMTGERLRLSFMLFKGDLPSDPTADAAYRETHLWISVSERSAGS